MRHLSHMADTGRWACQVRTLLCCQERGNSLKGYSFVPSRYIGFVDSDTEINCKTTLTQMSRESEKLKERWNKNQEELSNVFKTLGNGGK